MSLTWKKIKDLENWQGDASLYGLSEAVPYETRESDELTEKTNFVVVSAIVAFSGPETYIFPSDKEGEPINFLEMRGSFKGGLDHEKALNGIRQSGDV